MLGFAPLSSVPLSSLPVATGQAATGFVSGSFGTPLAGYARTQDATGAAPSTTFGTAKFGTTVAATGIAPNTKLGAPPRFGPNILQIVGNGADGETTFVDESPYYRGVTRNGSIAKSTAQSRFGTGSIALTGASTANNLSLGASALYNLGGGGPFTIEAQVYLNAYNASGGRLMSVTGGTTGYNNAPTGVQWSLEVNATGIQFVWTLLGVRSPEGGGWSWWQRSMAAAVSLSTWQHIEVSFDGTTMRLFVEGALVASSANSMELKATAGTLQIGALNGEASGATNAANAYIQQIRIRRDCKHTAAFTAPTAGLPSWIGELDGIAPTTQVATPNGVRVQPASGSLATQFGTGFGQNLQRPTGFLSTFVGDPRIFPYSPPPINSTQFGTARLFPFHVAPGVRAVVSSAVLGWQYWRVPQTLPFCSVGTPTTPTNRSGSASGFAPIRFSTPLAVRHRPPNTNIICLVEGFKPARFGAPAAQWDQSGQAQTIEPTVQFGDPRAFTTYHAEGTAPSVQFGTPTTRTTHRASDFKPVAFGLAGAILTQRATGTAPKARFGAPKTVRSNWYEVRGFCPFRAGNPRGYQRNNYGASGFAAAQFGLADAREIHRVSPLPPATRPGAPLLKRNTTC